jgi:hypothetical protein
MKLFSPNHLGRLAVLSCGLLPLLGIGCQGSIGGQTLPSAYYLRDDVQYFPAGPEFKLLNEATAMELHERELIEQGIGPDGQPLESRRPGFSKAR